MNSVTAHEYYIHTHWEGPQELDDVKKMNANLLAAANKFKAQDKPLLLLVSTHGSMESFHAGLFTESLKILDQVSFQRIALYGEMHDKIITIANTIIHSFKHDFEMKHFADKDQALAWLREYRSQSRSY